MEPRKRFDRLIIEQDAVDTPVAAQVRRFFPAERTFVVEHLPHGKGTGRDLMIALGRGAFVRPCPGSPGMLCCNLHVMDLVVGCPYDCAYCFLHSYQNVPGIVVLADFERAAGEAAALARTNGSGHPLRVTTGELGDSLALEPLTGMASRLVSLFGTLEGVLLELKTKSASVGPLLPLEHNGRVVLSWSMSPSEAAREHEPRAPSPAARLAAAARAAAAGYRLAFHFDPIIRAPGWEAAYTSLAREIFARVPAERVLWFSLGGFRFTAGLKQRIRERMPRTRLFLDEFVPGPDGKHRYFAPVRASIYRALARTIEECSPGTAIYLCMEAAHMWRRVFGGLPGEIPKLAGVYAPRPGFPPFSCHHSSQASASSP